ncbi:MAG: carbohydrate-binding protein, partial [Paludibacter sp.]|nr:carbohydrate-binding protein [Paludibacter sp.]
TEFCAWESTTTQASQKKMLIETFDYLETDPDIFRYAWFKERGAGGGYPYYQLLDMFTPGKLTELGEIFTYMSYYDDNYYFPVDVQIPAEQYIRMNRGYINMEKTTDTDGHINLCGMNTQSWLDYNVNIPEDGEYNVYFRISNEYAPDDYSILQMSVNGTVVGDITFNNPGKDIWFTQSCKVNFQQGQQKIRLKFTKGGLRINWWEISQNDIDAAPEIEVNNINVYPNPVKDLLHIQTFDNDVNVTLCDIFGKTVFSGKLINGVIDITSLSVGMYILNIENSNKEIKVQKIIKED